MRQRIQQTALLLLTVVFLSGLTMAQITPQQLTIFGVTTTNQLVRFTSTAPGTVTTIGTISGLQAGENILGIDFRPSNGQLYGLGSTSRLYIINTTTGAATQVGTGTFTTALSGTNFGFDFNPVPDAIRIVSDTGQNLRVNPTTAAVTVDGAINPGTPQVTAAGYTNNFAGAVNTMLFVIDTSGTTDRLAIQNPPNNGTLVTVGPLGIDASGVNGFDISATDNRAFAALQPGVGVAFSTLYSINLQTGAATAIGAIGSGLTLRGLAISLAGGGTGTGTPGSRASRVLDYDGDGRTDFALFRTNTTNNTGTFVVGLSGNNSVIMQAFGFATDDPTVPGDYDGDGRTDFAVYRRSGNTGTFFVLRSSDNILQTFQFGLASDQPVPRDYDGDGRTDFAVVRRTPGSGGNPGTLTWFIQQSTAGFRAVQFGFDTDVPAPGDYDGDGRFDLAVFRGQPDQPATFFVQQSTAGFRAVPFGLGSDLVVPGDYDGDGRTDFAVLRTGTQYVWYVLRSSDNTAFGIAFGEKPQISAQGDYDGDGRTDFAVYDPRNGTFYVARSVSNGSQQFARTIGQSGDYPVANFNTF
jgi:hypothetical protein